MKFLPLFRPSHLLSVAIAVLLLLGAGYAFIPQTQEVLRTTAPRTPVDVERFGGGRVLGQSFIAPDDGLSEIHVFLQTPVPHEAFPLLFHLRHGRYATTDIRTVVVTAANLDTDGTLRIRFAPIEKSGGRPYVFLLDAHAVRPKQLAAYRQIDSSIYEEGFIFAGESGVLRAGDLEFAAVISEPRAVGWWKRTPRPFLSLAFNIYFLPRAFGIGAIMTGVILGSGVWMRRRRPQSISTMLGILVVTHIILHAPFLLSYPGVNDEGSYLMDIQDIRAGYWPFRDVLTKGPLFLIAIAPVALFLPHTLLPARLLVAGLSGVEVILLYVLGRNIGGQTVGLLAATLWALAPVTIAQTSQLFLQPFSIPLVTLALILVFSAHDAPMSETERTSSAFTERRKALVAGILLALAYLVRASSLAFIPPALLLLLFRRDMRVGFRNALFLIGGFAGTFALVAIPAFAILGYDRTAVMFNVEALVIGQARAGGTSSTAAFSLLPPSEILERFTAYGAVLFRLGMPLVLLWLAMISHFFTRLLRLPSALSVVWFLGLSLPLIHRVMTENFTLAGSLSDVGASLKFLTVLLTLLITGALLWRSHDMRKTSLLGATRAFLLLGGGWFSLILLYTFFGRFRQQYHAEFLPLYVLGSALFLAHMLPTIDGIQHARMAVRSLLKGALGIALVLVVAAALVISFIPSREQPHTGSIPHRTALDVAKILRKHSSPGEEILTAQGLFTFYADRFLAFGASHPGWYLEERVGTVPTELRRLFLPDKEEVRRAMRERPIRLVVIDRRTREVYLAYDPEMRALLKSDYRLLETVPNPYEEDPVEIWIRK